LAATGPQGSAANSAGNVWTGPPATSAVADAATAPSVVMTSRYFTKANERPNLVSPVLIWFNNASGNPIFTIDCPGASFSAPPALLNGFDSLVAVNTLSYPDEYEAAAQWWNERNLYEKLENNPSLKTSNVRMSTFAQNREATPMAQLLHAKKSISTAAANTSTNFQAATEQHKSNMENLSVQLGFYDSTEVAVADTALIASLKAVQAAAELTANGWKTETGQHLANIRETVQAIVSSNVFETNERWVQLLYLDYPAKGLTPSSDLLEQLKTLGLQCPLLAGPAAVSANTLYELLTGKGLSKENCTGGEERNSISFSLAKTISIYPNPANEQLEVHLGQITTNDAAVLTLCNHTGQIVLQQQLSDTQNRVSITALQNGLYFVTIAINGTVRSSQKIIIIH